MTPTSSSPSRGGSHLRRIDTNGVEKLPFIPLEDRINSDRRRLLLQPINQGVARQTIGGVNSVPFELDVSVALCY